MKKERNQHLRTIAKIAILAAMADILMLFEFPLSFLAPGVYKLDFSDIPALLGGFAMGPIAGVLITLFKNLLHCFLPGTSTAFVGEFANFVTGCAFILPATLLYRFRKTQRRAVFGLAVGTVSLAAVGAVFNYFVLIPAFSELYGLPIENIVAMGSAVNPAIGNLATLVVLAVAPFNLIKGALCSFVTLLLYKHVSPLLHR